MSAFAPSDPVLLTGASGFVGASVARRLLERGHEVHVLLRAPERAWRLADIASRLVVHRADILDGGAVRAAFRAARPRAVIHLAAYGAYERQAEVGRILESNVLGAHRLIEAAVEAGVALLVATGSSSEYGYRSDAMREADRLRPNSAYAVAKAAQTHLLQWASDSLGLPTVTLRLFSVYGPWEEPTRLFPTVIRRARAGLPLEMVAPGTARDFVYVDDVVDALTGFDALASVRGEVVNIGTGVQSTMRDVVAAVTGAVGDRSEVRWGAMPARVWDTDAWRADVSRARERLGWVPKVGLAEGVRRMAEWMERVGDGYGPG